MDPSDFRVKRLRKLGSLRVQLKCMAAATARRTTFNVGGYHSSFSELLEDDIDVLLLAIEDTSFEYFFLDKNDERLKHIEELSRPRIQISIDTFRNIFEPFRVESIASAFELAIESRHQAKK